MARSEPKEPLSLDSKQREAIFRKTDEGGYRRIRGPAGAGKSIVVAARAARLGSEGKRVLVVCYNRTIKHYLKYLSARPLILPNGSTHEWPSGHLKRVEFHHFHSLCWDIAKDRGFDEEYQDLIRRNRDAAFQKLIPELILRHLKQDPIKHRRDAVLVDEGQDFTSLWWQVLRQLCKERGEMLLAADGAQDVYGIRVSDRWTDNKMRGDGFAGPWSTHPVSYRLPQKVAEVGREFAAKHLGLTEDEAEHLLPLSPSRQRDICELRWVQTRALHRECVQAALNMVDGDPQSEASADLTILVAHRKDGILVVDGLQAEGFQTIDTFSRKTDESERRMEENRKKERFGEALRDGTAKVKVTTVHSFKGWESRLLVLSISDTTDRGGPALFYTGLTRTKHIQENPHRPRRRRTTTGLRTRHVQEDLLSPGSRLTVVCSDRALRDFGKEHFENFSEEGASQP